MTTAAACHGSRARGAPPHLCAFPPPRPQAVQHGSSPAALAAIAQPLGRRVGPAGGVAPPPVGAAPPQAQQNNPANNDNNNAPPMHAVNALAQAIAVDLADDVSLPGRGRRCWEGGEMTDMHSLVGGILHSEFAL